MMKLVCISGLQYAGETIEQADAREAAEQAYNESIDALWKDWERQRAEPMPAMREWARRHGLT